MEQLKDIFERYKIYKVRIDNFKNMESLKIADAKELKENYKKWDKYVQMINRVLDSIDKDYSDILKHIYLKNKHPKEMDFAKSTFYHKRKKAAKNFLSYVSLSDDISY